MGLGLGKGGDHEGWRARFARPLRGCALAVEKTAVEKRVHHNQNREGTTTH